MTIAVDFDGTIVEHAYPAIGKELPFAIDSLKRLAENGHKLILWTVREGKLLDEAIDFCRERGLEFYAVNAEYPGAAWSGSGVSRKLKADVYIDDRAVGGIPDWSTIYDMITCHITYQEVFDRIMDGDASPEDIEFTSGSFSRHHHHHHHKKKGLFSWLKK